jgi:hypothetical protein
MKRIRQQWRMWSYRRWVARFIGAGLPRDPFNVF